MSESKLFRDTPAAETERILSEGFYGRPAVVEPTIEPEIAPIDGEARRRTARATGQPKTKPTHYKVICISLYTKDIETLEAKVAELKRRGHPRANKSLLIRLALEQLDLDSIER